MALTELPMGNRAIFVGKKLGEPLHAQTNSLCDKGSQLACGIF